MSSRAGTNQPFDQAAGTANVTAAYAQGFAERSHLDIDIFIQVLFRSEPATIRPNYSDGVRFIEQKKRSETFF
jgi:hypothetical protein